MELKIKVKIVVTDIGAVLRTLVRERLNNNLIKRHSRTKVRNTM
jgi:hypothetical protein